MAGPRRTAIVSGASQGIGAGLVKAFVERGFNVVANSRKVSESTEIAASERVHVLDAGHFALDTAADEIADLVRRFMTTKQ
jgi:NAD(P)-dependent dehydrogenase (short-subunit alcohol dehydrogenase family)